MLPAAGTPILKRLWVSARGMMPGERIRQSVGSRGLQARGSFCQTLLERARERTRLNRAATVRERAGSDGLAAS